MSSSAVICITTKNNQLDIECVKNAYEGSDFFMCPIRETRETDHEQEHVVRPDELVGREYADYAFCLAPRELICFLSLRVVRHFLVRYDAVVVLADSAHLPRLPESENEFSIFPCVFQEPEGAGTLSLDRQPLYYNGAFAASGGVFTSAFLLWCEKEYDRVLFRRGENRGFLQTWLSYSSLFGCGLKMMHPACTEAIAAEDFEKFEDGAPVATPIREYYGIDYRLRKKCGHQPFLRSDLFTCESVVVGDTYPVPLTAIVKAIYMMRPDLRQAFPNLSDPDARMALCGWFLQYASEEYQLDGAYTESVRQAYEKHRIFLDEQQQCAQQQVGKLERLKQAFRKGRAAEEAVPVYYPQGVNLCGFIKGDFGLGESARILARILEHAGIPFTIVEIQDPVLHTFTNTEFEDKISNEFKYDTNIFAYNPDCFEETIREFDKSVFAGRWNIGYWAWEMPEFPDGWEKTFQYFDEIWTCSDFTTQAIAQRSPIPVRTVPYAISPEKDHTLTRGDFGLPEDKFIFLLTYDTRSISERKNPKAAIAAFCKAFGKNEDVHLLIKMNTPLAWSGDEDLIALAEQNDNIDLMERQMSKVEINSLISLCDAYLSLHRSEGFGLGPAEAMAFGKPAVLTDFGGNTQYMREGACCPVPYRLVEIEQNLIIYKKGMHWAEADIDAAAGYMKRLVEDARYRDSIGKHAKQVIDTEFSYDACGKILRENLARVKKTATS